MPDSILQRPKARELYLQAAEQIIRSSGHAAVTVRRLSKLTGYTYPTLYHYFSDLDGLLCVVRDKMTLDMAAELHEIGVERSQGINRLKNALMIYTDYYLQNPNVFRFFYFYSFGCVAAGPESVDAQAGLADLWQAAFADLIASGTVDPADIPTLSRLLIYSIHGMISLCFSNNGQLKPENLLNELDQLIDYLVLCKH